MIFDSLLHDLDLFFGEPSAQSSVSEHNLAAGEVVDGARSLKAQVVIGSDGIGHVGISPQAFGNVERGLDDAGDVWQTVCLVKTGIFGENVLLDKFHQVETHA